jgi:hypothetical protein
VIVSDLSDWWQNVLVLFCKDQLGLATIASACLDIRLGSAVISGRFGVYVALCFCLYLFVLVVAAFVPLLVLYIYIYLIVSFGIYK